MNLAHDQTYGLNICGSVLKAILASGRNQENVLRCLATLSLCVQIAPLHEFAAALLDSGLYGQILTALEDDKASGLILAGYLGILARIAVRDPALFIQLTEEHARRTGRDAHKQLEEVFDAMWRNFDYVGESRARKLVAMGAGALLTTGHQQALERLDGEFCALPLPIKTDVQ